MGVLPQVLEIIFEVQRNIATKQHKNIFLDVWELVIVMFGGLCFLSS
jgi:hypothetical protein